MKTPDLFGHEVPPASAPPPKVKQPKRPAVAWRDFSFDELLVAVSIGVPGADLAAYRRASSSVDLLDLADARATARALHKK